MRGSYLSWRGGRPRPPGAPGGRGRPPLREYSARMKLHIGAGTSPLAGWTNVDILPYPGVDAVLDVTRGLPFENVELIFAEHFLEHLSLADALRFIGECRRVLNDDGVLRVSTPNLDWVWL